MPNYFTYSGYKLYFWSNESDEPVHVHVAKGKPKVASTKFWLLSDGTALMANNKAELNKKDLKRITKFIELNYQDIVEAWNNFFQVSDDETKYYK